MSRSGDPSQLVEGDREDLPPSAGNAELAYRGHAERRLDQRRRDPLTSALEPEEQPGLGGLANLELPPGEATADEPVEELPAHGHRFPGFELEEEGRPFVFRLVHLDGIDDRQDVHRRGVRLEITSDAGAQGSTAGPAPRAPVERQTDGGRGHDPPWLIDREPPLDLEGHPRHRGQRQPEENRAAGGGRPGDVAGELRPLPFRQGVCPPPHGRGGPYSSRCNFSSWSCGEYSTIQVPPSDNTKNSSPSFASPGTPANDTRATRSVVSMSIRQVIVTSSGMACGPR